jgi:hypothetical protein
MCDVGGHIDPSDEMEIVLSAGERYSLALTRAGIVERRYFRSRLCR